MATNNPLHKALKTSLSALPPELLESFNLTIERLLTSFPKPYSIYEPLLLLPAHAYQSPPWITLLSKISDTQKQVFYEKLAASMKVTHIALNSPISPTSNIERRPSITPLYGDFGPFVTSIPTTQDFQNALWVSTKQNGILQTWAPMYTMFSRGNIKEKARLLQLDSVTSLGRGKWSAVDLYVGIGYFSFSYLKAGAAVVVGFELNAWSIEGARKGAEGNGWDVEVVLPELDRMGDDKMVGMGGRGKGKLMLYQMSNEHASSIISRSRHNMPPVRHVNLGLLPTSEGAYGIAVRCLDSVLGGWLHVHENFAVREIEGKGKEVLEKISNLVREARGKDWTVELEHIERVKTYAPGVMHCVLDFCVSPPSIE